LGTSEGRINVLRAQQRHDFNFCLSRGGKGKERGRGERPVRSINVSLYPAPTLIEKKEAILVTREKRGEWKTGRCIAPLSHRGVRRGEEGREGSAKRWLQLAFFQPPQKKGEGKGFKNRAENGPYRE